MTNSVTLGTPHMSAAELALFTRMLGESTAYFEFGMGGSSLLAVRAGMPSIVMVDSDPAWVASVRGHPEIAAYAATGKIAVLHADIGPVREWGNPLDRSEVARWPRYLAAGWAEWAKRQILPDLVFVDGRFRVACCYSVVLATGGGALASPRVMLHDFNEERPHYRDVLEFFEIAEQVESLCLLRVKQETAPAAVLAKLLGRQFDYG